MDNPVLELAIEKAHAFITKDYRADLVNVCDDLMQQGQQSEYFLWQIESLTYEDGEDHAEKLSNVYNALAGTGATVFLIIRGGARYGMYIGASVPSRSSSKTNRVSRAAMMRSRELKAAFSGNFPGSRLRELDCDEQARIIASFSQTKHGSENAICSVSGTPCRRTKPGEHFIQGMERLLDAMSGQDFTFLYVAENMTPSEVGVEKLAYENLFSKLSPLAGCDVSVGENETSSLTKNFGVNITHSVGSSFQISHSNSQGESTGSTIKKNLISGVISDVFGGEGGGSRGHQTQVQDGVAKGGQVNAGGGANAGLALANASGKTHSRQIKFQNKCVLDMMDTIDATLKRIRAFENVSAWRGGAYFISPIKPIAMRAALTYRALMSGGETVSEPLCINSWTGDVAVSVAHSLMQLRHPSFRLSKNSPNAGATVRPCSLVSGHDLALLMGMPVKSTIGISVSRFVPFDREVQYLEGAEVPTSENSFELGSVFYMGSSTDSKVRLSVQEIAKHLFITGTPGSGKSTTVYRIIDDLSRRYVDGQKEKIKFLVIEPAKGEYKNVFGGRSDVNVFSIGGHGGTFLSFNPFRLPDGISLDVHISRLVDVFNACWSMYAAMPSILKRAIVRIYEDRGWHGTSSKCYGDGSYPTFRDLLRELPRVVEESDFSAELKGNYTGALVERVRDLTEGVERDIFLGREIDDDCLFDHNAIVDLSEGLSDDTRALVMGFLILKMDERHKALHGRNQMNQPLSHVTILEEAHCLLRRTSMTQNSDGANVQGKSVQMITAAIKEMRTYGEGFVIVDQSPTALDDSVISCVGTKIVHRLPSVSDYTLVGRSMSLTDLQMPELSRLGTGVAVALQGGWASAPLVKVGLFKKEFYQPYHAQTKRDRVSEREAVGLLLKALLAVKCGCSVDDVAIMRSKKIITAMRDYISALPVGSLRKFLMENINALAQKGTMSCWYGKFQQQLFSGVSKLLSSVRVVVPNLKDDSAILGEITRFRSRLRVFADFADDIVCENTVMAILLIGKKTKENSEQVDLCLRQLHLMRRKQ